MGLSKAATKPPPKDGGLRHGEDVTYEGQTWQVWCQAPGEGRWWVIRWDDVGKCHHVSAHRSQLGRAVRWLEP